MTALSTPLLTLLLAPAQAETPACAALPDPQRQRAAALMEELHIHDCCDQPLARCLEQQPRCTLAERMSDNLCRRVAQGQEDSTIQRAFQLRAWTMQPYGEAAEFELDNAPTVGIPEAPVHVVVYSAPRGYHCARVVPGVHDAIAGGALQGKARMHSRLYPLRSNEHGKEAGLAFLAAHHLGGFWDFLLHSYTHFDDFELSYQAGWAESLGMDRVEFERLMADPAILDELKASKREGARLGVSSTPTFFIDGQLYRGEMEVDEIVDTIEEAWEHSQGMLHAQDESP